MKVDPKTLVVVHNQDVNRFEIHVDPHLAVLNYSLSGKTITFTHTGVPTALEGQGVGGKLVKAGLEHARENGYQVKALCSFVAAYLRRHPEYQDLTAA